MQAAKPIKKTRPLRRDAQRNREAIVAAAADAFAREGVNTPLERVAKAAGVAIGTVYGHFPTRLELIESVLAKKIETWHDAARQAVAADDPWTGFAEYLEVICRLQADDRALCDIASTDAPLAECIESRLSEIRALGQVIVRRAQSQGTLRADVSPDDMAFVIWAHGGVVAATRGTAPEAWRRHLALMLDGFRAEKANPLPMPPLDVAGRGKPNDLEDPVSDHALCKVFGTR
ncbi:TetR/AcrR family transcriptional regulator [Streptomyces sp. NPDC006527]|uniref:TetR/AcrR family transcriptional regulator n=1 Tax=Streptomyces sp. NPDC006527 TaxID=3364749 RepID=UPI0036C8029E